jgi:hypothetical protein
MSKPTKIGSVYLALVVIAVLAIFAAGWYKYIYTGNYWLYAQVSCDIASENCFAVDVDAEAVDGETAAEATYFKIIKMKASAAPICDEWSGNCPELSCENLPRGQCQEFMCSAENAATFSVDNVCSANSVDSE